MLAADLVQEGGFPGAAHPDDRRGLAGKLHTAKDAAARVRGQGCLHRFGELFTEDLPHAM